MRLMQIRIRHLSRAALETVQRRIKGVPYIFQSFSALIPVRLRSEPALSLSNGAGCEIRGSISFFATFSVFRSLTKSAVILSSRLIIVFRRE